MTSKRWWQLCAVAGAVIVGVQLFAAFADHEACGPTDGLAPILAFELVHSPAEVDALFGSEPCRSRFAAAMDKINRIDMYLFIPALVCFLGCGALAAGGGAASVAWATVILVIVAGVCDQAEDQILLAITAELPGTQSQIDWLFYLVRIKFALLGIISVAMGALLAGHGGWTRGAALMLIVSGLMVIAAIFGAYWLLMPAIALSWLTLWIVALGGAFQSKFLNGKSKV